MSRPLDGVTVVAIERAVAAPLATRNLADLGARVAKVERVDGGDFARGYDHVVYGTRAHFVWLNRALLMESGMDAATADDAISRGIALQAGRFQPAPAQ